MRKEKKQAEVEGGDGETLKDNRTWMEWRWDEKTSASVLSQMECDENDQTKTLKTACRCAQFCMLRMSLCVASFLFTLSTVVSMKLKVYLSIYTLLRSHLFVNCCFRRYSLYRNSEQRSPDTSNSSHELPMEPRAKVELGSGRHTLCSHFPKDPNCDICLKTEVTRVSLRRRTVTFVPRAEHCGDIFDYSG